jgi:hypothetical protein
VSQDVVKLHVDERIMDNWAVSKLIDWPAGKKDAEETKEKLRAELGMVLSSCL